MSFGKVIAQAKLLLEDTSRKDLCTTIFPKDRIHPKFKEFLHDIMMHNSIKQMGIGVGMYKSLVLFERDFYMPEMYVCLNMMQNSTPIETKGGLENHLFLLENIAETMTFAYIQIENEIIEKHKKDIKKMFVEKRMCMLDTELFPNI